MLNFSPALFKKSALYAAKTFVGALICWYGLSIAGAANPVWAVITVFIVSDPDLTTTLGLTKTRALNTAVGCAFGVGSLLLFGYSPLLCLLTAAFTVLVVNLVQKYPANWRLAPVTVVIILDAGRLATSHHDEIDFALTRMWEIALGSIVALALALLCTRLFTPKAPPQITGSSD